MNEIWKDIDGYGGLYKVSNFGNVLGSKGGLLKPRLTRKGYHKVVLHNKDRGTQYFIHRLVAIAFIPNPEGKPQVNHKDTNKRNNAESNLEWATQVENMKHGKRNNLYQCKHTGESSNLSKLKKEDVIAIRHIAKSELIPQREIGDLFFISREAVSAIKNNRNWINL